MNDETGPRPKRRGSAQRDAYVYRRELSGRELVPAFGAAAVAAVAVFYVAKLLLQRTPLDPPRPAPRIVPNPFDRR
jgi:hypothetical protein